MSSLALRLSSSHIILREISELSKRCCDLYDENCQTTNKNQKKTDIFVRLAMLIISELNRVSLLLVLLRNMLF